MNDIYFALHRRLFILNLTFNILVIVPKVLSCLLYIFIFNMFNHLSFTYNITDIKKQRNLTCNYFYEKNGVIKMKVTGTHKGATLYVGE